MQVKFATTVGTGVAVAGGTVGVRVGVRVRVGVGVRVDVGVRVGVGVRVDVGVRVGAGLVGVRVGDGGIVVGWATIGGGSCVGHCGVGVDEGCASGVKSSGGSSAFGADAIPTSTGESMAVFDVGTPVGPPERVLLAVGGGVGVRVKACRRAAVGIGFSAAPGVPAVRAVTV